MPFFFTAFFFSYFEKMGGRCERREKNRQRQKCLVGKRVMHIYTEIHEIYMVENQAQGLDSGGFLIEI